MSGIRDKVDRFLFNFSYSLKIKSIILLASATAIMIAVLLIGNQRFLLSNTDKQEFGIQYQQELNNLLTETLTLPLHNDARELQNSLERLSKLSETPAIELLGEKSIEYEGLDFSYMLLLDSWDQVQAEPENPLALFKMVQAILQLGRIAQTDFELNLNIDTSMNYLLIAITDRIPAIQTLIGEIALHTPETLGEKAHLIYLQQELNKNLDSLQKELALARAQNDFIDKEASPAKVAPDIASLNALSRTLAAQATRVLQLQVHTLLVRQYYGVGFIGYGLFVILAAYTTRLIRRPLAGIRQAAEKLAQGTMGVRIQVGADDEVGKICHSFNELVARIEKIIQEADGISDKLASSSTGIFSTAKQLESNIIRQEQAITQIASNAKGVSRTVQDFARSLQEVTQAATVTAHLAHLGRTGLNEMGQIMHQMAKASMSIVKTLSDLQDKIGKVNSIINAIVRIADQINLLSLNTAIRAGKSDIEHLGFSVIADKISELADQTALATLDIEELVERIVSMVTESVAIVDQFSDQIRSQVFEATEIGNELNQLITNTEKQFEAFESVNRSMQAQTLRAQQIHESIIYLTDAAQKTTHAVRNLYLEIEYLHHSTNNLQVMTKKLTSDSYDELTPQST